MRMLRALYDYAQAHPEIVLPLGWAYRTIDFVVDLPVSGPGIIGVRALDKSDRRVACPSAGKITSGADAHPIAEKASVAICLDVPEPLSDAQQKKLDTKRSNFLDRFVSGQQDVPAFGQIIAALSDPVVLDDMQTKFLDAGGQAGNYVSFSVGGIDLWQIPEVRTWWEHARNPSGGPPSFDYLDVVTGEPCEPARLWTAMRGECARGGQSSGVSLVSFNAPAFDTYIEPGESDDNGPQGKNCPVSESTMSAVMDAAIYLSSRAPNVGNLRLCHWYAGEVSKDDDPLASVLDSLFFPAGKSESELDELNGAAMDAEADRLARAPFTGDIPPGLENMRYHMLYLQPESARMVIRKYEVGRYSELHDAVAAWFADLELVSSAGYVSRKLPRLYSLLAGLLSPVELAKKSDRMAPLQPHVAAILDACFHNRNIPDCIAYRAFTAFRSGMYPGAGGDINWALQYRRVQWLRLWVNRTARMKKGDANMSEISTTVDKGLAGPAYVCGRLMAAYDMTQQVAAKLKSSVVSRYFTACSQGPAMVLGRLQSMSVHHLDAISSDNPAKAVLQNALAEIWSQIDGPIPARLTVAEQAYFACGYWQEMAALKSVLSVKGDS